MQLYHSHRFFAISFLFSIILSQKIRTTTKRKRKIRSLFISFSVTFGGRKFGLLTGMVSALSQAAGIDM